MTIEPVPHVAEYRRVNHINPGSTLLARVWVDDMRVGLRDEGSLEWRTCLVGWLRQNDIHPADFDYLVVSQCGVAPGDLPTWLREHRVEFTITASEAEYLDGKRRRFRVWYDPDMNGGTWMSEYI